MYILIKTFIITYTSEYFHEIVKPCLRIKQIGRIIQREQCGNGEMVFFQLITGSLAFLIAISLSLHFKIITDRLDMKTE